MAQQVPSLEELRKMIGWEENPSVLEIEKWVIKKFAEAVGDPNPLWQDEAAARKSRYRSIVAPPMLLCSSMVLGGPTRPDIPLPYKRMLDGGGEWEFFLPVKYGDVITSVRKLTDIFERQGKTGKMLFFVYETTHKNQKGELVAKSRGTLINLE